MSRPRAGGPTGGGSSRGPDRLIIGIGLEVSGSLGVGARLLRGRSVVVVDALIVVLEAIKRH